MITIVLKCGTQLSDYFRFNYDKGVFIIYDRGDLKSLVSKKLCPPQTLILKAHPLPK